MEKSQILDEYGSNTGRSRKYAIGEIHRAGLRPKQRKEKYDSQVKAALAKIWEISDHPCGQRLKSLLEPEAARLRELQEMEISEDDSAYWLSLSAT